MKKTFLLISALVFSINVFSQGLSASQIFAYQERITSQYGANSKQIDDIIEEFLRAGWIVKESINESRDVDGSNRNGNTFVLKKIIDTGYNETIAFTTILINNSGKKTSVVSIRVETSDFGQYQKWYTDLKSSTTYTLFSRFNGQYVFAERIPNRFVNISPIYKVDNTASYRLVEPIRYFYRYDKIL